MLVFRYVREWLGAMVVAGIVQMKRSPDLYFLSKDRHSTLVGSNLPTLTEALFLLGKVEKDVIGCFQRDGPLGECYKCSIQDFFPVKPKTKEIQN